ncbi:hypothetical protein PN36_11215 [Candidatus Thiomargarita nelsonii]|uniref:Caspase family p20 domain-containing protein n=1 Tax=Candidatus Thiomargarita nelsonii TaxID=1003181 RepID=A0A0A6P742_9GAMM|nr:hypothetical protein PN36_11215 [Candidatus Thiomargarita nelsonii]
MNFSTGTRKKRITILLFILLSLGVLPACNETPLRQSTPSPDEKRGKVLSLSTQGETILSSYSGSYALLIGESDYTNGWQDLRSIPGELKQVEILLKSKGFHVEKSLNLNSRQLKDRFNTFINDYGFDKNNRLLFFYSGHGETYNDTGYLVPTDAPTLGADEKGFWRKALRMNEILTMARGILAKHALFLFDSCFSGMVFKAKKQPKMPKQISQMAKLPVRQFITAGDAGESVPAKSVFTPVFIDALRYGKGDLNKDGYVTGVELGFYLQSTVPQHARQTPQFGKISDYELARGDFVFAVGDDGDGDGDGVADNLDKCPDNTSVELRQGVDQRGCPIDKDQDKVADYRDSCLGTNAGVKVKENGCPVPKTIVSKPSSYRYSDNGDGTVTDNRSGLIWLKKANCFGEPDWETAMQSAANLADGQCGLRDGSRRGDWRLPTENEWVAMVDNKYNFPTLSNAAGTGKWKEGDAFSGVQTNFYWSSSANGAAYAWFVDLASGLVNVVNKSNTSYVWPVRGGH